MKRPQVNPNRGEVSLPTGSQARAPVFVDPRVSADAAYAAGAAARRKLPKTVTPVAGGAGPSIPHLDQVQPGMTLEQQANLSRQPPLPSVAPHSGGIIDQMPQPEVGRPMPLALLPTDLLPPDAQRDPAFRQGHGAMVAANQPELAAKYGVIRGAAHIPPQRLGRQQAQLRPQTLQDLETLNQLHSQNAASTPVGSLHSTEAQAEASMTDGAAAAAARVGNLPGDDSDKPLTVDEKKDLIERTKKLDEFDLDSFRQAMMKDILNNPEQKDLIEAKLKPLSIDDMITKNFVEQDVEVRPGLIFTYQSISGEEDLAIKRLIMGESKSIEVTDRYLLDKYSFMSIAIGLKLINNKPMGTHVDKEGNFDDDAFWAKFNKISKLPLHMLASIGVNLFWFEMRVRKLFVAEKVGNG